MSKTAIITGATSGIGRATAIKLFDLGYSLILTGRREDRLNELQNSLDPDGQRIACHAFDIRNYGSCAKFAARIEHQYSEINLLVNNAGLALGLAPIQDGLIEDWDTMLDTNVKGLLYMTKVISPLMIKQGDGMIINICSTAGKEVYPNGNVYCASKHAVDALTKSMRIDLYKHGIRVGQVCPGHVEETEFAKVRFHGDQLKARIYEDFNPLRSSDVANVIAFMSEQPPHVSIQDVVLTGAQQAGSTYVDRSGRKFD